MSDVLAVGDADARWRVGRTAAVIVVVLLVVAAGWWVDRGDRRQEFDRLLGCVRTGQATLSSASARVTQISNYIAPALSSSGMPSISSGLFELVQTTAAREVPAVQQARDRCQDVGLHFWHHGLESARSDYVAYLDARLDVLRATAGAGAVAFNLHPELDPLRAQARHALAGTAVDGAQTTAARSLLAR